MLTEIRITDEHAIRVIEAEQEKTGERSATKTAIRLIMERLAIREAHAGRSADVSDIARMTSEGAPERNDEAVATA